MSASSSSLPKNSFQLDASLGRYAVAAGAALSASLNADAAITNLTSTGGFTLDGTVDYGAFNFSDSGIEINFSGYRSFFYSPGSPGTFTTSGAYSPGSPGFSSQSGQIWASGTNINFLKLDLGQNIAGFGAYFNNLTLFSTFSGNGGGPLSPAPGGNAQGYLAFNANVGGENMVGWLRVSIGRGLDNRPSSFDVIADGSGFVGAFAPASEGLSVGDLAAIPEPASAAAGLGLLALGAAGLRRRRALSAGRN